MTTDLDTEPDLFDTDTTPDPPASRTPARGGNDAGEPAPDTTSADPDDDFDVTPDPDESGKGRRRRTRLRVLPAALGSAEALSISGSTIYTAGGPAALTATAVGGTAVAATAAAAMRARRRAATRRASANGGGGSTNPRRNRGGGGTGRGGGGGSTGNGSLGTGRGGKRGGGSGWGGGSPGGSGTHQRRGRNGNGATGPSGGPGSSGGSRRDRRNRRNQGDHGGGSGMLSPHKRDRRNRNGGGHGSGSNDSGGPGRHRRDRRKGGDRTGSGGGPSFTNGSGNKAPRKDGGDRRGRNSAGGPGVMTGTAQGARTAIGDLRRIAARLAKSRLGQWLANLRKKLREKKNGKNSKAGKAVRAGVGGVAATLASLLTAVPSLPLAVLLRAFGVKWRRGPAKWFIRVFRMVWRRITVRTNVATDFDEPGSRSITSGSNPAASEQGEPHMSVFALTCENIRGAYSKYDPSTMLDVAAEYKGLPFGLASITSSISSIAVNTADKYPADKRLADLIAHIWKLMQQAQAKAEEILPKFLVVHEWDLRKYHTPRNNEAMWNIGSYRRTGGYYLGASHFQRTCEDMAAAYASFHTDKMMVVGNEYAGVPVGLEHVAAAINHLATKSADVYPVDNVIAEMVKETHDLVMHAAGQAQQLHPAFRRLHARDIARHEAPRKGSLESEAMWDA